MADHRVQVEIENPSAHTPLLDSNQNQTPKPIEKEEEENDETLLEKTLKQFDTFLAFLGFHQSSALNCVLSWTVFLVVGIVLPIVVLEITDCDSCKKFQIKDFELVIIASQACLAAVSLLCLSHNLRKYGIRRFLSVDRQKSSLSRFHNEYVKKIWGSIRLLVFLTLPCFILKIAREVSAIVQLFGIILCLHGATKISHRAQGIASVASRWHALVTCGPDDVSQPRLPNGNGNLVTSSRLSSLTSNYSEGDLQSLDIVTMPTTTQLASYMSYYHKRQAFVMYLQTNPGGITIFGWTVDRALLNTIFFIELTLVTFVLGKTIVYS